MVPAAFWVGFLALGFVTSIAGPGKHRAERVAQPARIAASPEALVAQARRIEARDLSTLAGK
jgi:hypothetical protein